MPSRQLAAIVPRPPSYSTARKELLVTK